MSMLKHQIRKQIYQNLNYQYRTTSFTNKHTFIELIQNCEQALRRQRYPTTYQLPQSLINKYSMKINECEVDPFEQRERKFLYELAQVCEKIICEPGYQNINKVNKYVVQRKLGLLCLNRLYKRMELGFRYVGLKQAFIFTALSHCNVWYTICKNRKKSNKQFDLDPLIEYFNNFVAQMKLQNPYHIDILPKKQAKNIERKINQEKIGNPLYQAVANQNHNLAKQLLQKGAKVQSASFLNHRQKIEVKCSHRACLNGDLRMCKILDSFGADWQAEDGQKMTPIFYAIQASSLQVIQYLVQEKKVDIQRQQIQRRTPFYWACTQGDIKIIDYLYQKGCNINHKSELGRTALSKSCYLGRMDIVLFLLGCKQIDMYSQCKKGRTALHNAVFGPKGGREGHKFGTNQKDSPQCAQILLEKGMNVDILDFQDCTSLHIATSSQAIDSIRLLLSFGASLTLRNNYGETPLMTGAKFGHVEACRILYQQYGADILCIDIFNKNLLLLTAKFQQNIGDDINSTINPAYMYFLQPFIQQCLRQDNIKELHRTFRQIVNSQFVQKTIIELTQLWKAFKKYEILKPQLGINEIESILKLSMSAHEKLNKNNENKHLGLDLALDILKDVEVPQQKLSEIHIWLIKNNEPKILQFVHENQLLSINKMSIKPQQMFSLFENDELSLKQKVVTFCLLSVDFDWINYQNQQKSNILHLLVRKQKSGCIVQLFKALTGKIPPKILTNKYINKLSAQQCKKVLQNLLWDQDESGLDAHQLSMILKNKSVAKLIEQKLKQEHLQFSNVLDVKDYALILETDPQQLQIFNNFQHEKEEQLSKFEQKVKGFNQQQISLWWRYRKLIQSTLVKLQQQNVKHQVHENFWNEVQNRPLYFINETSELQQIKRLEKEPVLGIDLQYFNSQGVTLISLFQISSLSEDFIIDCLNVPLKTIKEYLRPLLYNENILKIMHGADNDLILIKSSFNLSLINFVDTSRLDIELRDNKYDLRGLAALSKDYLGTLISKEYQISEWRIRPIPKAMLQYAKKDSMILPFLLMAMLKKLEGNSERIKLYILGGCKQTRKNKKTSQPLLQNIKII